jgi:hypothetical protein
MAALDSRRTEPPGGYKTVASAWLYCGRHPTWVRLFFFVETGVRLGQGWVGRTDELVGLTKRRLRTRVWYYAIRLSREKII